MSLTGAIIIVLVLVAILFIALLAKRMPIWGSKGITYYQKCANDTFRDIKGDTWSDKNQETLDYMASVPDSNKGAYDYFVTGSTYMYGRRYADRVAENYKLALREIARGNVYDGDRDFIISRIRDHVFYHPEPFGVDQLAELQEPIMDMYEMMLNDEMNDAIQVSKTETKHQERKYAEPPQTIAEIVERKAPDIRTDSQNVHDSAITLEFSKQYQILRIYNNNDATGKTPCVLNDTIETDRSTIKDRLLTIDTTHETTANVKAMEEFMKWMKETITDQSQYDQLNRRFVNNSEMIDRNGNGKIAERDVIAHVWRRIHSTQNDNSRDDLLDALGAHLIGCFENNRPVCVTGRTEQIFSSLATLDKDPRLGMFMTTELLKSQMYSEGAKIIDEEIAKLPRDIRDAYNSNNIAGLPVDKMKILSETIGNIHRRLDNELAKKYSTKLPQSDGTIVVKTIKDTVTLNNL